MAKAKISSQANVRAAQSPDLSHITEEMYKKNLELTERNKMLSLLRTIDEIVLGSVTDLDVVAQKIVEATVADTGFVIAGIYLTNRQKTKLEPVAISGGSQKISEVESRQFLRNAVFTMPSTRSHVPLARALSERFIVEVKDLEELKSLKLGKGEASEIQAALNVHTWYLCPLTSRHQILGVMLVGLEENLRNVTTFQKMLLERLMSAIGIALDNTMLYRSLREATQRLRTANRHLKELDVAKDEFISMASHQLRTPLTTIKGYISMLMEGDVGKLSAQQKEFLDYAYGGSQRMVNLINDLLNVSRMQAGKFMIEKAPVDLVKVTKEEVFQLQTHAQAKGLKLVFVPPKQKLPPVKLDEGKTRQVLMNFIDNAIYYTQEGSVTVTLTADSRHVVVEVADSGIGVPMAAQKQLFTKFYRAPNAQTLRPDGTGLGLYLAKRVVEDQDGSIIFRSIEGKGSTFGFKLPLKSK